MRTSARGLALIKSFEGCLKPAGDGKLVPYICPAGVLTIGWGHTNDGGRSFTKDDVWRQDECDQALGADMVRYEAMVERHVTVVLTQGQFDALVSFTYNCGEGNLAKSTLLRRVNARDWDGAANAFAAWNRGGGKVLAGLTRRRAAEAAMFRGASPAAHLGFTSEDDPMPQRVDAPDEDAGESAPAPATAQAPAAPSASGFFGRLRNWVVGGASTLGFTGLGFLTDWQIAVVFFLFVFIASVSSIAFVIWFFGKEPLRDWVVRHVA